MNPFSAETNSSMQEMHLPSTQQADRKAEMQYMVLEYLAEYGMYKAALSLKQEIDSSYNFPPLLKERDIIRELCLIGDFLGVLEKTASLFPCLFSDHPILYVLIIKQDILEDVYIREKPEEIALARIEKEISPVVETHPSLLLELEKLVGAIAFKSIPKETIIMNRNRVFEIINKRLLILFDYEMNETLKKFIEKVEVAVESAPPSLFDREDDLLKILYDYIGTVGYK